MNRELIDLSAKILDFKLNKDDQFVYEFNGIADDLTYYDDFVIEIYYPKQTKLYGDYSFSTGEIVVSSGFPAIDEKIDFGPGEFEYKLYGIDATYKRKTFYSGKFIIV